MMRGWAWWLWLAGCSGDGASYTLAFSPHTLDGVTVFDAASEVVLTVSQDGERADWPLGPMGQGAAAWAEQADLPAYSGAHVGLRFLDPSDGGAVLAWGDVGPIDLVGRDELDAEVLIVEVGGSAVLDTLPERRFGAGVVVDPSGAVFSFGGSDGDGASDEVLSVLSLDEPLPAFEAVAQLPDFDGDGEADARFGATATWTPAGVLLAGGRSDARSVSGGSRDVALFDPSEGTWAWSASALVGRRSEHRAVRLADGQVLLMGGWPGEGLYTAATAEIVDPVSRSSRPVQGGLPVGGLGFDVVALPGGGALACGGAAWSPPVDTVASPQAGCILIKASGEWSAASPLPAPSQGVAMAALPDGCVLATGGVTQEVPVGEGGVATDRAWLWDGAADAWTEVGPMIDARVGHRAWTMADGRVLITGGVSVGAPLADGQGPPVPCAEVFDPETGEFVVSGRCDPSAGGWISAAADHPQHGVVQIEGEGPGSGGYTVALIGVAPAP